MLKKTIISFVALILLAGVGNAFAEEDGCKGHKVKSAKHQAPQKQVSKQTRQGQFDNWFKALKKAHRENDREKMGKLIQKMEQRKKESGTQKNGWNKKSGQTMHNRRRAGKGQVGNRRGGGRKFSYGQGRWSRRKYMSRQGRGFRRFRRGNMNCFEQRNTDRPCRNFTQENARRFHSGRKGMGRKDGRFQHYGTEEYPFRPQNYSEKDFDWDW